jgi:hypothetical protein
MVAGRGIFRDFWLDERGAGLGVVVFGFKSAFHIFGVQGAKEVGPTGGRQPGVSMNRDLTMSTCRLTSTSSQVGRVLDTRRALS